LRSIIRKEAVDGVIRDLAKNKRTFTITAPTGAGKTYTLLAVASEIQKQKGNLGIIYALPFLSITEQVQDILKELGIDYLPVNSKAANDKIENARKEYEQNPTPENLKKLLNEDYAENTFDHPFIVTTFVQFFETLVSNNNATLLKLPNFSDRIFLIDEFQAIPPRLYIFFSAWLHTFCLKNNSYAILSTATMPKLDFPVKATLEDIKKPEILFKNYLTDLPYELTSPEKHFNAGVFNRYIIHLIDNDKFTLDELALHINKQSESCLIILNTIADTKNLYNILNTDQNTILLNTHFIPVDRLKKIDIAKDYLRKGEKVILISTQLIEAGVDIDFPIVYRDLCPLPSLIQSAGRCNRNKLIPFGNVYMFRLINEQGKAGSELIYRKEAAEFLKFCKKEIISGVQENQLFSIQSKFFEFIKDNLSIGEFEFANEQKANMIECINNAEFEQLGRFQLINEYSFGEQYRYYIPADESDISYFSFINTINGVNITKSYEQNKLFQITVNDELKKLGQRIINVRIRKGQTPPQYSNSDEKFEIRVLADISKYTFETGLELGIENQIL
jgi:CRISPR-associated endonuclease/helicase Cas3